MKYPILTLLMTVLFSITSGQGHDTWTAFWNEDTSCIGFKDKNGLIKIEPKFSGFTVAQRFDDIIAVSEEINDSWHNYYLTKPGRIVGRDSLYIFDNGADCESGGFIRFRDPKTDKAGVFNRNGDIRIPAEYNDLTRVRNGMIIAIKDAKKEYFEGGEIFRWTGGNEMLIDTNNNVLVENFKYNDDLNFFSSKISAQPDPDTIRQNFRTKNGQYISFIDFDKEFRSWLRSSLLKNFTKRNLLNSSDKEITYWKEPEGWKSETRKRFVKQNFEIIKTRLLQLNSVECNYEIFSGMLNPYIYDTDEYRQFFNNCGEPMEWIYPVKDVVISYDVNNELIQDHFEFLRTGNRYRLISVTIR